MTYRPSCIIKRTKEHCLPLFVNLACTSAYVCGMYVLDTVQVWMQKLLKTVNYETLLIMKQQRNVQLIYEFNTCMSLQIWELFAQWTIEYILWFYCIARFPNG